MAPWDGRTARLQPEHASEEADGKAGTGRLEKESRRASSKLFCRLPCMARAALVDISGLALERGSHDFVAALLPD